MDAFHPSRREVLAFLGEVASALLPSSKLLAQPSNSRRIISDTTIRDSNGLQEFGTFCRNSRLRTTP
jgi:hypothetical protein